MDVIVDGASQSIGPEPKTAVEAIAAASEALRAQQRAVVAVRVDGAPLRPEELPSVLGARTVSEVGRIEIQSEDVAALVDECLRGLEHHLPDLPAACHGLAEVFQGSRPEEGFEPFQQLARIWEEVKHREAMVVSALALPLDEFEVRGAPVSRLQDELNEFLNEAADALEAGDCVTLGDLLEYELAPRAETEADIVALLREQAQKRFG
jgi:hypothetical protein